MAEGGRQTKTMLASAGGMSGLRMRASASATVASGAQHDRFGGHQAACGVVGVVQQPPHGSGLAGLHQGEQLVGLVGGQLPQQVGGVVGIHRLQHVRGPVGADVLDQRELVGFGQLLEDVGQPLVVERVDHLVAAFLRQLGQRGGDVGGPQRLQHREQPGRALPVGEREPDDRAPRHDLRRSATASLPRRSRTASLPTTQSRARVCSTAASTTTASAPLSADPHRRVDQLADDQHLVGVLAEPAQAHRTGGERDGAGIDGGDPQHRHEDPPTRHHLHDHAEHPRRVRVDAQTRHEIAHSSDPLTVGPVDGEPDQPRDENAIRSHAGSLVGARRHRG